MKKTWKDIKGYKGFYQISNNGEIKSLARTIKRSDGITRRVGQKMLVGTDIDTVQLSDKNKVMTKYFVYQLMLSHFTEYEAGKYFANKKANVSKKLLVEQYYIKRKPIHNPVTIGTKNGKVRKFKNIYTAAKGLKISDTTIRKYFDTGVSIHETKIDSIKFKYPVYKNEEPKVISYIVDGRKSSVK